MQKDRDAEQGLMNDAHESGLALGMVAAGLGHTLLAAHSRNRSLGWHTEQ